MLAKHGLSRQEFRFRPRDRGRFASAGFLGFWLCGWAFGEVMVLWLLVKGAAALFQGEFADRAGDSPSVGPVLMAGLFLAVWLALWTIGGVLAIRALLRMVWSQDRVIVGPAGLTIRRRTGPIETCREIARHELRDIGVLPPSGLLMAEIASGSVEITSLGTLDEREAAASALRQALDLREPADALEPESLPRNWREVWLPEGGHALISDPGARRNQARVVSVVAMVAGAVALFLLRDAFAQPSFIPLTVIASGIAAGLAWWAVWLARGRMEWRLGVGSLTLQRRFGSEVRPVFAARSLALERSTDGDGDPWFTLEAAPLPMIEGSARASHKDRCTITSAIHDPTQPRRLGLWLSRRTNLPIVDRSSEDSHAAHIAALRAELPKSGRIGRFAARCIDRLESRRRQS